MFFSVRATLECFSVRATLECFSVRVTLDCFSVRPSSFKKNIQCSPFITLCFGSIGMDHVISELCYYKGTIFQMSYGKMTIS